MLDLESINIWCSVNAIFSYVAVVWDFWCSQLLSPITMNMNWFFTFFICTPPAFYNNLSYFVHLILLMVKAVEMSSMISFKNSTAFALLRPTTAMSENVKYIIKFDARQEKILKSMTCPVFCENEKTHELIQELLVHKNHRYRIVLKTKSRLSFRKRSFHYTLPHILLVSRRRHALTSCVLLQKFS